MSLLNIFSFQVASTDFMLQSFLAVQLKFYAQDEELNKIGFMVVTLVF